MGAEKSIAEKMKLKDFIEDLRKSNGNLRELLERKLSEVKAEAREEFSVEETNYLQGQLDLLQIQGEKFREIMQRSSDLQDPRINNGKTDK